MESLEAMNNFLKSEKEELILEISAKNKKIELLEKRVRELTEMRSNVVNGSRNGIHDETDLQINALDEELSKTKHRVCELEVRNSQVTHDFVNYVVAFLVEGGILSLCLLWEKFEFRNSEVSLIKSNNYKNFGFFFVLRSS